MSFPWAHRIVPVVRNIPRDIDEMLAIQRIDDPEHEVCALKHSNFDLAHPELSVERTGAFDAFQTINAAARRAEDPGIIELVTSAPPANDQVPGEKASILLRDPSTDITSSSEIISPGDSKDFDVNVRGELSYRVFEQVQEKKRRKLEAGLARRKTLMISVKVGSTSSRSSLFGGDKKSSKHPMLLPAVIPHQEHRSVPKSKNASRSKSGRSQLVWLEKQESSSQRVSYTSYLTKEKVEPGLHKRSREVSVGIRVNGALLMSGISLEQALEQENSTKRKREERNALYDMDKVNDALDAACTPLEGKLGTRQCSMDTEAFVGNIISREKCQAESFGEDTKVSFKDLDFGYHPPRVDCLPAEDGLIHVLCTHYGNLKSTSVSNLLNRFSRKETRVCSVCWKEKSSTGESIAECSTCGVLLHPSCCNGVEGAYRPNWKCGVCSLAHSVPKGGAKAAPSYKCAYCPHVGGAMSQVRPNVWVHEVCRIWRDPLNSRNPNDPSVRGFAGCALCCAGYGPGDGLTKCAAAGCSVRFHPMCALFLSKCEENSTGVVGPSKPATPDWLATQNFRSTEEKDRRTSQDRRLEKLKEEDKKLCRQYTLAFAKCWIPGSNSGAVGSATLLPVCFCGIHNPRRDRSLYGLYPGGDHIDEHIMRVPPRQPKNGGSS